MTKKQRKKIDKICKELEEALQEAGLEIDHHCEFLSAVIDRETGEKVGEIYGTDVMIDWEE